jgi:beta propeller repeat protein
MKILSLAVLISICLALSGNYASAAALSSGESFIYELSFSSQDIFFSRIEGYDIVRLPDCVFTSEIGRPQIPYKVVNIAIAEGKELDKIELVNDVKEAIEGEVLIYPVQESVRYGQTRKFTPPDPAVYSSPNGFPQNKFEIKNSGSLSGIRLVVLYLYPLEYFPAQRKLVLHTSIKLKISFKRAAPTVSLLSAKPIIRSNKTKQTLFKLLQRHLANAAHLEEQFSRASAVKTLSVNVNTIDYLIITSEVFKTSGVFQRLIDSKKAQGFSVELDSVKTIQDTMPGRDLPEQIRNFIKKKFTENGVLWVLLGGDKNIVPVRMVVADGERLPCDMYYADLDGDWDANGNSKFGEIDDNLDLYPDVFVGRAPVETEAEVLTFINKLFTYQTNIAGYSGKALFLGHKEFNDVGSRIGDLIEQEYLPKEFGIVTKYYERDFVRYADLAIKSINEGYHLINHIGHADNRRLRCAVTTSQADDQITMEDIDRLTNAQAPSILYSIGCWTVAVDYDCIAGHWITNPNGGGVAFIGNSRSGWYPQSEEYLNLAFYDSLFWKGITAIGQTLADSKIAFIPEARSGDNRMRYCLLELSLLGDPAMNIRIDKGSQLNISSPSHRAYVKGKVDIFGSAFLNANFDHYELYSVSKDNPDNLTSICSSPSPVQNGRLTPNDEAWDTTKLPDGEYFLLLKLFTREGKKIESRNKLEVIIDNYNQAPIFSNLINRGAVINRRLEFKVQAVDPDDPKTVWGQLQYSATNLPPGADFDPATQVFSWLPTAADKGIYQVIFTASDNPASFNQLSTTKTITVATVVIEEEKVTDESATSGDFEYDLYGDKIVWCHNNSVYLRDFSHDAQAKLIFNTQRGYGIDPALYKDRIVFTDSDGIYMYELSQPRGTPPLLLCSVSGWTFHSAIYADKVVWSEGQPSDIYMYNLSKNEKKAICTAADSQSYPEIYGNKIIWVDKREGASNEFNYLNGVIYMYDLANPSQAENGLSLFPTVFNEGYPAIYNNTIVWVDYRNGNRDIYMYDFSTQQEKQITSLLTKEVSPDIYGDKIVWKDYRNGIFTDIYLYDLSKDMEIPITSDSFHQSNPKVFKNKVCWIDWRNSEEGREKKDIYLAKVIFVPQITSLDKKVVSPRSRIVINGRDFGEAQDTGKVVFANGANGAEASIRSWSDTQITCTVPIGAVSGEVKVITAGGTSNAVMLTIDSVAPVISHKPPLVVINGKPVIISATVRDDLSGIKTVILVWQKCSFDLKKGYSYGKAQFRPMQNSGADNYQAVLIPSDFGNAGLVYTIVAQDNAGNGNTTRTVHLTSAPLSH